jgi:hypothetical protein
MGSILIEFEQHQEEKALIRQVNGFRASRIAGVRSELTFHSLRRSLDVAALGFVAAIRHLARGLSRHVAATSSRRRSTIASEIGRLRLLQARRCLRINRSRRRQSGADRPASSPTSRSPTFPLPPSIFGLPDPSVKPGDEPWSLRRLSRSQLEAMTGGHRVPQF